MPLPNELLHQVFGFLDHTSLKTCAVVCPDLAGRYLYATITIREETQAFEESEGYVLNPNTLALLISKNPQVADYARTLIIDLPLYGKNKTSFIKLTKLESITLSHRSPHHDCWPAQGSDFNTAFLASLRLPCLRAVHIHSIADFPLSALLGCKNLKKLTIQAWDVDTGTVLNNPHVRNHSRNHLGTLSWSH